MKEGREAGLLGIYVKDESIPKWDVRCLGGWWVTG